MVDAPIIDSRIATDLLTLGIQKAKEVSEGRIKADDPASIVHMLLEAVAVIASAQQLRINSLPTDIQNSIVPQFGIARLAGSPAIGTAIFTLDALYSTPFTLPRGFPVTFGGVVFLTTTDLLIPAYTASGTASLLATTLGLAGNQPTTATATYQAVTKLANITLAQPTKGGLDAESDIDWQNRVYATIRTRDTLVSESDFSFRAKSVLGVGSLALTVGRLKPDKVTYANGYVSVFALNPDGTVLTSAQLTSLQSDLSSRAAMATVTLWSLTIVPIKVSVVVSFLAGNSPDTLAALIEEVVVSYLSPGTLAPGDSILPKAIERRVQGIKGIMEGVISVEINGLAAPCALPSRWSVAQLGALNITLISIASQQYLYTYTFDSTGQYTLIVGK